MMNKKDPPLIEAVVDSIRISLTNAQRIVMLKQTDAEKYLTIWIGPYEAESITIALQEIEVARPQTHDLVKNILTLLNTRLVRVEITSLKEDVYYGRLILESKDQSLEIDSRPSDAIALAVRYHAPIQIVASMMDKVGIVPERDLLVEQMLESTISEKENDSKETFDKKADEDRLSVFKEFLNRLEPKNGGDNLPGELDSPKDNPSKKG